MILIQHKLMLTVLFMLTGLNLFSQNKVKVLGLEEKDGSLHSPNYMIQVSKDGTEATYDSRVIGNPGFFPGYVIAGNGEKLEGFIALLSKPDDLAFVKRWALLVFEEDLETAYYLGPGDAFEIYQNRRKDFLQAFLDHLANWDFAASQLK